MTIINLICFNTFVVVVPRRVPAMLVPGPVLFVGVGATSFDARDSKLRKARYKYLCSSLMNSTWKSATKFMPATVHRTECDARETARNQLALSATIYKSMGRRSVLSIIIIIIFIRIGPKRIT